MVNLFKTQEVKDKINAAPTDYQTIIDEVGEYGICITDQHGQYKAINKRYSEILGYVGPELHGKHFSIVCPPETADELNELHSKFIFSQREISRRWEVVHKSGKRVPINADARFSDKIDGAPHKITFIEPVE